MTEGIERAAPDFLRFLSMEESNLLVSVANNREEFGAMARVEGLYNAAMNYQSIKSNDVVLLQFLTFIHYQFLFSMACQMRCHLSEAFGAARAAIDAALNAAYIINDRAAQVAYAKREKPFDNLHRHLGNLKKDGKPLPHPLMAPLIEQQKAISTFAVHADIGTFVHRVNRTEQYGQIFMSFQYFQFFKNDDERKLHTLSLLHIFVATLDVFADFVATEAKVVPPEWKTHLHQLGATIERHLGQLRERLRNSGENATGGEP